MESLGPGCEGLHTFPSTLYGASLRVILVPGSIPPPPPHHVVWAAALCAKGGVEPQGGDRWIGQPGLGSCDDAWSCPACSVQGCDDQAQRVRLLRKGEFAVFSPCRPLCLALVSSLYLEPQGTAPLH